MSDTPRDMPTVGTCATCGGDTVTWTWEGDERTQRHAATLTPVEQMQLPARTQLAVYGEVSR